MNAVEIESAISDLALEPFDAAEFPFVFLAAFGNKETALKRLRAGNNNASDVPGGVLLRSNIHIAACDSGSVGETLKALRASPATTKAKAKFILATDGQTLEAEELITGETIACDYPDFPNHFGFLLPLAGISTIKEIKDNPIDVRATSRLNKLYVELLNENPDWATEERRVDMNHFMARLVFCFFAEDTDIFNGDGLFTKTVEQVQRTRRLQHPSGAVGNFPRHEHQAGRACHCSAPLAELGQQLPLCEWRPVFWQYRGASLHTHGTHLPDSRWQI